MSSQIFVNIAVKDLEKSMRFFAKLGFSFNAEFSDENAACMIISEEAYVMLLVEKFFKTFTPKNIADTNKSTEVLISLSMESREKVDELLEKAISMGAVEARDPQDDVFMYARSFSDLDGHIWELFWMEPDVM